ncbi:uncharacterized protein LOC144713676 [Wolffia australiana]
MAEESLGGGGSKRKRTVGGAPLQWRRRRPATERRRRTVVDPASLASNRENFELSVSLEAIEEESFRSNSRSAEFPEEGNEAENADLDRNPRFDKRRRIPSAEEMEEFFAEAEKQEQLRFLNKYNFDVVRDAPMAGRFLWISAAP